MSYCTSKIYSFCKRIIPLLGFDLAGIGKISKTTFSLHTNIKDTTMQTTGPGNSAEPKEKV